MLSLHLIENFLRFQVQDKHNASSFSHMSWIELPQSNCKIIKKVVITGILQANYYTLVCVLVCFIKLNRVQARDYNNKKRPASSSYGMLTGSAVWGLVQIPISWELFDIFDYWP